MNELIIKAIYANTDSASEEYDQEKQEVELWLAELSYDEPDHLAWLEELDIEESEVE